ncbi:MAG: AbfB domain-containing protein, partial [Spirochaetales bacterium]|nr:AbfB domain-containing protein [Spirochaetales bacterium]
ADNISGKADNISGKADISSAKMDNMSVSFESCDMPGWYIGVDDEELVLLEPDSDAAKEYTTFNFVPGFADASCVSIQSASDPGYYVRRRHHTVRLHEYSAWMLYKKDATWRVERGLADKDDKTHVTFRVWNDGGMVIRHLNRRLFVEISDGSEPFEKAATFIIRPPNWNGVNRVSEKKAGERSFSRSRAASFAAFSFYIALVLVTAVIVAVNRKKRKPGRHWGKTDHTVSHSRKMGT